MVRLPQLIGFGHRRTTISAVSHVADRAPSRFRLCQQKCLSASEPTESRKSEKPKMVFFSFKGLQFAQFVNATRHRWRRCGTRSNIVQAIDLMIASAVSALGFGVPLITLSSSANRLRRMSPQFFRLTQHDRRTSGCRNPAFGVPCCLGELKPFVLCEGGNGEQAP